MAETVDINLTMDEAKVLFCLLGSHIVGSGKDREHLTDIWHKVGLADTEIDNVGGTELNVECGYTKMKITGVTEWPDD